MKIKKLLKENLLLEVYDSNNGVYYKSLIQEVDDESIAIGIPMKDQKQLLLPEGSEWEFRAIVDDALYFFTSKILGKKIDDQIPLYLISWPERVKRQQRRNYYRLPCVQEIYFWILPPARDTEVNWEKKFDAAVRNNMNMDQLEETLGEPKNAVTSDLSGGGLSFVYPNFFSEGTVLAIKLFLQSKREEKDFLLKGKIVWTRKMEEGSRSVRYRYGVQFIDLSEKVREEIVRFVFTLSREKLMR